VSDGVSVYELVVELTRDVVAMFGQDVGRELTAETTATYVAAILADVAELPAHEVLVTIALDALDCN
jgi:hypothetical protein